MSLSNIEDILWVAAGVLCKAGLLAWYGCWWIPVQKMGLVGARCCHSLAASERGCPAILFALMWSALSKYPACQPVTNHPYGRVEKNWTIEKLQISTKAKQQFNNKNLDITIFGVLFVHCLLQRTITASSYYKSFPCNNLLTPDSWELAEDLFPHSSKYSVH